MLQIIVFLTAVIVTTCGQAPVPCKASYAAQPSYHGHSSHLQFATPPYPYSVLQSAPQVSPPCPYSVPQRLPPLPPKPVCTPPLTKPPSTPPLPYRPPYSPAINPPPPVFIPPPPVPAPTLPISPPPLTPQLPVFPSPPPVVSSTCEYCPVTPAFPAALLNPFLLPASPVSALAPPNFALPPVTLDCNCGSGKRPHYLRKIPIPPPCV